MNASDVLVESLLDWGVEVIFGLPGDGINGFVDALRTHKSRIRYIHVRHEETAAMAACGYAKMTGKLGVCFATTGPGAIHLMNGLYDAKIDQAPVLAATHSIVIINALASCQTREDFWLLMLAIRRNQYRDRLADHLFG